MANWFLDVFRVIDGTVLDNFASFLIFPPPSMFSLHTAKTKKTWESSPITPSTPLKMTYRVWEKHGFRIGSSSSPGVLSFHVLWSIFPGSVGNLLPRGKLLQPRMSWCWCAIPSDAPTSATTNNDTARCQRHTPKASVAPWSCGTCRGGKWWGKTFLRAGGWAVDRRLGSSWLTWFGIAREMREAGSQKYGRNFDWRNAFFMGFSFFMSLHVSANIWRLIWNLDVAMGCIFFFTNNGQTMGGSCIVRCPKKNGAKRQDWSLGVFAECGPCSFRDPSSPSSFSFNERKEWNGREITSLMGCGTCDPKKDAASVGKDQKDTKWWISLLDCIGIQFVYIYIRIYDMCFLR